MTATKSALLYLTLGGLIGFFAPRLIGTSPVREVEEALDSIAVLGPLLEAAAERAAIAEARALEADTVLVTVTDTIRVVIERAVVRASDAADSLHALEDSTVSARTDELVAAHAEEVAAVWVIAEQRLLWGTEWRDAAMANGVERDLARAENEQLSLALAASESARRGAERNAKVYKYVAAGVTVIGVGATAVGFVTGWAFNP